MLGLRTSISETIAEIQPSRMADKATIVACRLNRCAVQGSADRHFLPIECFKELRNTLLRQFDDIRWRWSLVAVVRDGNDPCQADHRFEHSK